MKDFFRGVRKHIEKLDAAKLREQYGLIADENEALEQIVMAMDQGVAVLDAEGAVLRENPAARELLGMELDHLAVPLGKASKHEVALTYPEERQLEVRTIPMTGASTLVLIRDVTSEKQRSEEALLAAGNAAIRELASGVAHEIGNPLNALSLNLQLMARDYPKDESIAICQHQVERLDGIIRSFLSALRPGKVNLAPGNVSEPLTNCLKTLRVRFEEKRIQVIYDVPNTLPLIAMDKNQLEQVFYNLLKNGLEALHDGGQITISVSANDAEIVVRISDTGEGMDAGQLKHLFEPYQTSKEKGTGLGLMISARIVRDHGGTIAAESEKGRGTVFTVRLPRIEKRIRVLK